MFRIECDAAHHLQNSPGSSDPILLWNIPIVVDAPYSHKAVFRHQIGDTASANRNHNLARRRIDRKGATDALKLAFGSPDDRFRFHIALVGAVENQQPVALHSSSGSSHDEQVVDW